MRGILSRLQREKGQALIMFVAIFTVIMVAGAITVDLGLWLSERRGAQTDADLPALAGAYELLAMTDDPAIIPVAERAVYDWAEDNDLPEEDVHELVVDTSCWDDPSPTIDSVYVSAEHHSRTLFSSFFNVVVPEIGAHAKACVGSIISAEGLLPVGVQISGVESDCFEDVDGDGAEDPLFGQECVLTFGAGEQTSGESGNLRLFNDGGMTCTGQTTGGNQEYLEEIRAGGANTTCFIGDCVEPLTGVGSRPQIEAIKDLIATEGYCDQAEWGNHDGIDDFLEVVQAVDGDPTPSPDTQFTERDCGHPELVSSPRLVSLIIIEQFDEQGNDCSEIIFFAAFYIKGCEDQDGNLYPKCDISGHIGQVRLRGHFVDVLVTSGVVGPTNPWSPKRIILVE